jgi:ribonuclease E
LAPFELVWAGGPLGRATLQAYYWSYRARELLASKLARRREAERRRIEEEVRAAVAALGEPVGPVHAARPAAPAERAAAPAAEAETAAPAAVELPAAERPAATETRPPTAPAPATPNGRWQWLSRLRPGSGDAPAAPAEPPAATVATPPAADPSTPPADAAEPEAASPAASDETRFGAAEGIPGQSEPATLVAALPSQAGDAPAAEPPSAETQPQAEALPPADAQPTGAAEVTRPLPAPEPPALAGTREPQPVSAPAQQAVGRNKRRRWLPFLSRRAVGDGPGLSDQSPAQVASARLLADVPPTGPSPAPEETVALPSAAQIEPVAAGSTESELSAASPPEAMLQTDETPPQAIDPQPPSQQADAPVAPSTEAPPPIEAVDLPEAHELPPDATSKPASVVETPAAVDTAPQADALPNADAQPAPSTDPSPPHPTPTEAAAPVEAPEPKAAAAAPKSSSPQERRRWLPRFSRRKSSDEPPPDPPSPAPGKSSERSAG